MGKSQRSKGARGEYLVRDLLRAHGFTAHRVPASGAAQGFKGDIQATYEGFPEAKFEVKLRKDNFKTVYTTYSEYQSKDTARIVLDGILVTITRDPLELFRFGPLYKVVDVRKQAKNKILNLRKFIKDCNFLAIKDNNKPVLFLSFK